MISSMRQLFQVVLPNSPGIKKFAVAFKQHSKESWEEHQAGAEQKSHGAEAESL